MYSITYLCIFVVLAVTPHTEATHSNQPVHSNRDKLQSPINIQTSKVKSVRTIKPFTIYVEEYSLELVRNTGVAISFDHFPFTRTRIVGGLLSNDEYKLYRNFLRLNQNPKGRSGNAIDGKGYSIEGNVVFYNEKYHSFKNASNYDDGLVSLSEPVYVGFTPNSNFQQFVKLLLSGSLKNPNSSVITSSESVFNWYTSLKTGGGYYAYQGYYVDPETNKQTARATCVVTQPPYRSISHQQFEAFKHVLGFDGKPLNTITPLYPQGSRKVEGATGVKAVILPFSSIVLLLQILSIPLFRMLIN